MEQSETLSFEQALIELESIVQKISEGSPKLEDTIALYERGELLKLRCYVLLNEAQEKINKIDLQDNRSIE